MKTKILVIGLGISGKSAARFLLFKKENVLAVDKKIIFDEELLDLKQNGLDIKNENEEIDFFQIKMVVISPGISLNHFLVAKALNNNIEVIGEIELGFRYLKNRVVAITGTNGKTTTTTLISHVFNSANFKAKALGNIGTPLTSYLLNPDDDEIIILELSSFQLETLNSKKIDSAIILNITEDHLDRYESFSEYAKTKCNIKNLLKKDGKLFVTKELLSEFSEMLQTDNTIEIIENDINDAALKVCLDWKINSQIIHESFKNFKALKHRIELVGNINGISFYNDSKATNVYSVLYAIKKLEKDIILIVGGLDKGLSYTIWDKAFIGKVKHIFAIGQSAEKIRNELKNFDVEILNSLELAVIKAKEIAKENDKIVLSPGCSSFDMFKNYEHRGEEFKRYVEKVVKGENK